MKPKSVSRSTYRLFLIILLISLFFANINLISAHAKVQYEAEEKETVSALKQETSKIKTQNQDICLLQGTVQISADGINSLKVALANAMAEVDFKDADCFAPVDLRNEGKWAFITLVGLKNIQNSTDWTVKDNAVWSDSAIIHFDGLIAHAAIAGTTSFSNELAGVPIHIVSLESRSIIDPLSTPTSLSSGLESYRFPFELGYQIYYGTKDGGVHPGEFAAVIGSGSLAVDLMSDGNTGANHAPNRLLAVVNGTVTKKCSDTTRNSTYILIDNGNSKFLYAHIKSTSAPALWSVVQPGGYIGELVPGTFSDGTCGYASQSSGFFHVHLEFTGTAYLTLSDWTLNTSSEIWTRGSETWPSGQWRQIGGGACPAPSLSSPSDGYVSSGQIVSFNWSPVSSCTFSGYTFRVCTSSDISNLTNCFIDTGEGGTQRTETITNRDNQDLYWGVRAANAPNGASWSPARRFRIQQGGNNPPTGFTWCADENGRCSFSGTADVVYGALNSFTSPRSFANGVDCNNDIFGDPISGTRKSCYHKVTAPPTGNLHVEYFNDKNLGSRCYDGYENSTYVFKNWGNGSPANGCNSDNFSARFTGTYNFSGGNYSFHCQHDDGCRIFIDGQEKLNAWWDSSFTGHDWGGTLSGNHEVRIEFYDSGGDARLEAFWSGAGFLPSGPGCNPSEWCAQYFGNKDFSGTPAINRNEGNTNINYTWNDGGIGYGFPNDNFSARWQRNVYLAAGRYRFHIKVDDGGRLWVHNNLVIDQWKDQGVTEYTVDLDLPGGEVPIKFEYYEGGGGAIAQLWWDTLQLYEDNATFITQSLYPTVNPGDNLQIYFEVKNSGTTTWQPGSYWLQNLQNPLGANARQPISQAVPPNGIYRWTINQTAPTTPGVYRSQWMVSKNGSTFGPNMFIDVTVNTSPSPTFVDVQTDYWAWTFVERLYNAGITGGCGTSPLQYCPQTTVTRSQMAVFLLRGIHGSSYSPPGLGGGTGFGDVPVNYWSAPWIKQLAAEGITGGCGSGNYCPEYPVTRDQMAVFLLRSKYGASYSPPAVGASTGFGDVPPDHWAAPWIKQLVTQGITAGCGNGNYCPGIPVSRAQMAVFLVRTFNLP